MIILGSLESVYLLPISINSTFFARCYGRGASNEYRFKIGDFAPTGAGWHKISGRRGRPTKYSSSQKTTLHDLSYGFRTYLSSALSHCTRLTRRTDRQTSFSSLVYDGIPCSAEKTRCYAIAERPRCRVH